MHTPQCLVIERESGLHLLYRHTLQRAGYTAHFARSQPETMTILQTLTPHLIFVDIVPGDRDRQLLAYLQQAAAMVPVVVVTGTSALLERDLPQGYHFQLKPLHPNIILDIARESLLVSGQTQISSAV